MATLGLKEMGKFLWEGREKGLPCWLSQFSKTKQSSFGKCKKKYGIMKSGLDAMPLFLLDHLLRQFIQLYSLHIVFQWNTILKLFGLPLSTISKCWFNSLLYTFEF